MKKMDKAYNTSISNKPEFSKPLSWHPIPENKIFAVNFTFVKLLFLFSVFKLSYFIGRAHVFYLVLPTNSFL